MMGRWVRWLFHWLMLMGLAGLLSLPVHADSVVVNSDLRALSLVSRMQVFVDETASWTATQVMQHPGWYDSTPELINRGSTAVALWLRFQVHNSSSQARTLWLTMGNPRLEQVQLYRQDHAQGAMQLLQEAGVVYPLQMPSVYGMDVSFALELAAGETVPVLLRVESRTLMLMAPTLWEPMAYLQQRQSDDLIYLLPISGIIGMVLYLLINSFALGQRQLWVLAVLLFFVAAYDFAFYGYLRRYFFPQGSEWAVRLPHALALASTAMLSVYLSKYLVGGRIRFWRYFFLSIECLLLALMLLALYGDLRTAFVPSITLILIFYAGWPLYLWQSWRQDAGQSGIFILAMGFVGLFAVFRLLKFVDYGPLSGPYALYLTVCFKLVLVLTLLYGVIREALAEARKFEQTQTELLRMDAAEQIRLEELVRERSVALREAVVAADEAARAKSELLARVGHDLRAPLTAVVGYASRLEDWTQHDVSAIGRRIRQRAHELLALINGLIEYARVGAEPNRVRYQPVQFRAFLHDMRTDAQRMVQQCGHSFEWRVKGQLPDGVLLDSKRVRQVLSLLLQHTLTRLVCGKILCTVYALPKPAVGLDGVQRVMFMVHDNGPGFSEEDLVHIFQPLSSPGALPGQADWSVVIAQQWASRMGGYVKISSRIGQGTTLRLVLPVSRDMGSREMLADRQAAAPHFSGG